MYSTQVTEAAFGFYCQKLPVDQIVDSLRQRFPAITISQKTVEKWIARNKWRERRDGVREQAQSANDQKIAVDLSDDLGMASKMIETLFDQFQSMDAMSLEGVSAQLRMAIKLRRELLGLDGKGSGSKVSEAGLAKQLEILKRAMRKVPALAAVIDVPNVALALNDAVREEFAASQD